MSSEVTPKSWAKSRRKRKYSTRDEMRKANANGNTLRRTQAYSNRAENSGQVTTTVTENNKPYTWTGGPWQWSYQNALKKASDIVSQPNPVEVYLNRRFPNSHHIEMRLNEIITQTQPNSVILMGIGANDGFTTGGGKRGNYKSQNPKVSLVYKFSEAHKQRMIQWRFAKNKKFSEMQKQSAIVGVTMSDQRKAHLKRKKREYKAPVIREPELSSAMTFKSSKKDKSHKELRLMQRIMSSSNSNSSNNSNFVFIDLGCNRRVYGFGTQYRWGPLYTGIGNNRVKKMGRIAGIRTYKLMCAVDEHGLSENLEKLQNTNWKKSRKKEKHIHIRNNKSKRMKNTENRKESEGGAMKWQLLGVFDGSMSGFWFNSSQKYEVCRVYRIKNVMPYYDCVNMKHMLKNGVLCRYLKVIPCEESVKSVSIIAKVYGLPVDVLNRPVLSALSGDTEIRSTNGSASVETESGVQMTFERMRPYLRWSRDFESPESGYYCSCCYRGKDEKKKQDQRYLNYIRKFGNDNNFKFGY